MSDTAGGGGYGAQMRVPLRLAPLAVFLVLVVPLVAICAWRVPAGQVPDEPTHVMRAASLLHGAIIGHRVATLNVETGSRDAGVTGNTGLALAAIAGNGDMAPLPPEASRAARLAWVWDIPWQPRLSFVSSANTAAYAPVTYIPAALGLGAAILMGAKPHAAIIGARLANVLAFTLIGALALLMAARGRLLLLITLSLPMTIWLAGSVSQDGLAIAVTVLGAALLTRGSRAGFWCGCAALAVLVLQKPPFLPLAILPLVVPGTSGPGSWRRRIGGAVSVALPGLLWALAVAALVSVPLLPGPPYHPGPLWPGDPARLFRSAIAGAQIAVVMHHPVQVALLPFTSGGAALPSLWLQFIGVLGQLSIRLPRALYTLWSLAIVSGLGALTASPRPPGTRWFTGPAAAVAVVASVELIFLALYLTWTPVGMDRVDGIQGRYFLPLLPLILFVVPASGVSRRLPGWLWWPAPIAAILATDATLPGVIAAHFYR
ncbi:DUF2142 domain-containing protein [Acidisoma sp.]|uniref:DUF2142 domain-containing protein n=1 Tax=Acidisoma sp. TaxID=1872115 RepID=UPI003B00C080